MIPAPASVWLQTQETPQARTTYLSLLQPQNHEREQNGGGGFKPKFQGELIFGTRKWNITITKPKPYGSGFGTELRVGISWKGLEETSGRSLMALEVVSRA